MAICIVYDRFWATAQQRLHDLQHLEYLLSSPLQKECRCSIVQTSLANEHLVSNLL